MLSDKLDELRNRTGKPGKTVSLNYETVPPAQQSRSWEVRLNSSDLKTTGFPEGVMRGNFIKVNGSYLTVVDPLPCAEFGAQSPASGSSYNQFEITKVDCETYLRTNPVDPDEFWTNLWMTIHIQRKSTTTCRLACSNVLAVPQLATPASWCAGHRKWAAPRTPEELPSHSVPSGSIWCVSAGAHFVPTFALFPHTQTSLQFCFLAASSPCFLLAPSGW